MVSFGVACYLPSMRWWNDFENTQALIAIHDHDFSAGD